MSPTTKLIIENHFLGAVLDRHQFDTFYHEHPRTYSYRSFDHIARKLGRNIEQVEFPQRYNGNIRVVIGNGPQAARVDIDESSYIERFADMRVYIEESREKMRARLQSLVEKQGPLPAKAFPGRAAILIHSFGLDERTIAATYERSGSPKIGSYIPGTRIPILDEAEFFAEKMDSPLIVNLAWHIHSEIDHYMKLKGYEGEVMAIFG